MKFFSEVAEGIRISLEALRGNLMRSILTTVGIVIGVVTVTLMATAMEWFERTFRDAISFLGTDVLYVDQREWFASSRTRRDAMNRRQKITLAQFQRLERLLDGVAGVAPTVDANIESIRRGNRTSSTVTIIGTNEQFLLTGGINLAAGRFLTKAEAYGDRDVCVIGSDIAENLFLHETPLGQRLTVGDQQLKVVGVLEKRGRMFGQISLDNQVIIPIQKMIRGFRWDPSCTIQVKVGDPNRVADVREELRGLMRMIRKSHPARRTTSRSTSRTPSFPSSSKSPPSLPRRDSSSPASPSSSEASAS